VGDDAEVERKNRVKQGIKKKLLNVEGCIFRPSTHFEDEAWEDYIY
jgi:hypothetical protein